jgi:vancomycin resistance protein VanW
MGRPKSAWSVFDHRLRRAGLQAARLTRWWLEPARWPVPERYVPATHGRLQVLLQEVRVAIDRPDGAAALENGKRKNLELAVPAFDGLYVAPTAPLSFWRTLGCASSARGFTWGAELRGGCVVPSIAGGLCLLSNALFELAVRAGWRILERHGHSLEAIPPAPGSPNLDATVAWPDVDLVIAPRIPVRLEVRVTAGELIVAAFGERAVDEHIELDVDEQIFARRHERVRTTRVVRRRFDARGKLIGVELVASGERRLLAPDELGRTCISCGEQECRDRPAEAVLVSLRRHRGAS